MNPIITAWINKTMAYHDLNRARMSKNKDRIVLARSHLEEENAWFQLLSVQH